MLALRSAIGLLVQILPCAIFCLYPFASSLNVSPRRALAYAVVVLLGFGTVFVIVGSIPLTPELHEYRIFAMNIVFLLLLAVLCVLYIRLIDELVAKKAFVFLAVMSYGCLVAYLSDFARFPFGISPVHDGYMYPWPMLGVSILVNILCAFPMALVMRRLKELLAQPLEPRIWARLCFLPTSFLIISLVGNWLPMNLNLPYEISAYCFSTIVIALCLAMLWWVGRLLSAAMEAAALRERLESEARGYRAISRNAEEIRRLRHDMKFQLSMIDTLLAHDNVEAARTYLKELESAHDDIDPVHWCAHPLANALFADFAARAASSNVAFSCRSSIPPDIALDDVDFCRLLANVCENALEGACAAKQDGKTPFVRLTLTLDGSFLLVRCVNSYSENALRRTGGGFLTTKSTAGHGKGLAIIKSIVEKHSGLVTYRTTTDAFSLLANLCLKEE